jgi:hypothetical protein
MVAVVGQGIIKLKKKIRNINVSLLSYCPFVREYKYMLRS